MIATHNSPKEDHNRNTFVADPANDGSNKENEDNKTTTKPSTNNSIVVKKDADALTLSSKQTNTTVPSSKDNSKTEIASSDEESSLASSIDSEEFREQVTFCRLDENTYKEEINSKLGDLQQTLNSVNTTTLETNANVKEMKGTLETGLEQIVQLVSKNNATAEENITLKNMQKEYVKKIAELEAALEKEKKKTAGTSSFKLPSSSSTRSRHTRADNKSEVASEKAKKETSLVKVQKKKEAAEKKRKEKNHTRGTVML